METLYRKIADEMAEDIEQGIYGEGQKVPSVRMLSKQRSVSISTINQAYALLEDRGFIRSKPQSGYYVRDGISDRIAPPPMSFGGEPEDVTKSAMINRMLNACNQPSLVNLGAAIPDLALMPYRSLQTHIQKVSRFESREVFNYQFSPGYEPLRSQIAIRMRAVGVRCHSDDIVITHGCAEALSLCLRCNTKRGDIVAVESPCYYGFLQLADVFGLKVIEIPTDPEHGISVDALTLALQQWPIKIVMVNSRYSNPTGSSITEEKQKALVQLARRFDIKIIEDDIYGELGIEQPLQSVLKRYDTDGRVMYCSSFSKTVSPGMRIGWTIPGNSRQDVTQLQMYTTFSPNAINQHAMTHYLQTGHHEKHLRTMRATCQVNIDRMIGAIRQYFPDGTRVGKPKGGFILWVCLPEEVNACELQRVGFENGINIVPGDIFSNSDQFNHYIRLNCGLPWSENIHLALKKLGQLATAML